MTEYIHSASSQVYLNQIPITVNGIHSGMTPNVNSGASFVLNNAHGIYLYNASSSGNDVRQIRNSKGTVSSPLDVTSGNVIQSYTSQFRVDSQWETWHTVQTSLVGEFVLDKQEQYTNTSHTQSFLEIDPIVGVAELAQTLNYLGVYYDVYAGVGNSFRPERWNVYGGSRLGPIPIEDDAPVYDKAINAYAGSGDLYSVVSEIAYVNVNSGNTHAFDFPTVDGVLGKYEWRFDSSTALLCNSETLRPGDPLAGNYDLGTATERFKTLYLVNAPNVSSDIRKKKEVEDLDEEKAVDIIMKSRPVSYKWKEGDELPKLGFIAQELKEIEDPTKPIVHEDKDGFLSLDSLAIIPYLVKTIQHLNSRVLALTDELANTKNKIENLKI